LRELVFRGQESAVDVEGDEADWFGGEHTSG
jgi:hypothetical protein